MPVIVHWLNSDKTIIQLVYNKPWNWSDFQTALVEANTLMDTVQHPVDMIIQMHDGLPHDVNPVRFRTITRDFHRNIRNTALVGANEFIRRTITAFMRVMGQEHRSFFFAATLDDAHRGLEMRNAAIARAAEAAAKNDQTAQAS